jgi:hypothetical protein
MGHEHGKEGVGQGAARPAFQGDNVEEALENIKEAIIGCQESLAEK